MTHQLPTIIVNPVSGQGDRRQRLKDIAFSAKSMGWKGKIIETTPDILANVAAQNAFDKGQRQFVICGGDGTIMEAISALANKNVTIGIVPLGTGNLLAKNLKIPLDLKAAMTIALKGRPQKIDVGQANEVYFAIMAGMGVDAQIMKDTSRKLKNLLGLSAYYWTGLMKLLHPPVRFLVSVDGITRQYRAKTILAANMGKFAGSLVAVPHTSPYDGQLKIGIIQARSLGQLLDIAKALLRGNINRSKYYTLLEGAEAIIEPLGAPQPFQCDGNDYPATNRLSITIHPQAIAIRLPKA